MPSWIESFMSDSLLYGPFYAIADMIWNAIMSAIAFLMGATPQEFSPEAWAYVTDVLYPWAEAIGAASLNMFFIIGWFKSVSNLKENFAMERMMEALIKLVILNVLLLNGMTFMRAIFNITGALAGGIARIETPALFTSDVDIGSRLFFFLFGFLYFLVAMICAVIILITVYGRYIKLYLLVVFYPLAMPTLIGGQGVENTSYAWLRTFLSNAFEIVVIAMVMGIAGRVISGVGPFASGVIMDHFDGFGQAVNSLFYMILMTSAVGTASRLMNKAFNL